jgi:hypothetical protein
VKAAPGTPRIGKSPASNEFRSRAPGQRGRAIEIGEAVEREPTWRTASTAMRRPSQAAGQPGIASSSSALRGRAGAKGKPQIGTESEGSEDDEQHVFRSVADVCAIDLDSDASVAYTRNMVNRGSALLFGLLDGLLLRQAGEGLGGRR